MHYNKDIITIDYLCLYNFPTQINRNIDEGSYLFILYITRW